VRQDRMTCVDARAVASASL